MGRTIPWDEIPDSMLAPRGLYRLRVADIEETESKPKGDRPGKLMYVVEFRVVEPPDFQDMPLYERFVIGSDEDPMADEDSTWKRSVGAKRLKACAKACGVEGTTDIEEVCARMLDAECVVSVDVEESEGYDPANRMRRFFPLGEREPEIFAEGDTGRGRSRAGASRPAPAARREAPAREERAPARTTSARPAPAAARGNGRDAARTARPAPARTPARGRPAPPPAEYVDDDGGDDAEAE